MKQSIVLILLLVFVSSCESTKHIKRFEAEKLAAVLKAENGDLKKKIGALESQMNDTDQDGVADSFDVDASPIDGVMVDYKGKMINLNQFAVPDYVDKTIKVASEKLVIAEDLMGNIAFNCPSEMREEQTYEVNAMLGALFSKEEIQKSLLKSINISRIENQEHLVTMQDVLNREVNLGHYLNVILEDSGNKFDIKRINELANPIKNQTKYIYIN